MSIPCYLLSIFQAPVYFLNKVESVVSQFLWFGEREKGIVWRRWEVCCLPKATGVLGLRDLGCLNHALLAKVAWRLLKNPDSLLAKVLVGKYCWRQGLLEAVPSSLASCGWRGVVWEKSCCVRA